ncbi:hypothetical protein [Wohlfahrtiimonas chitiniclastica]|uniref:hypothetical protein n=1 Tax=Wohlfahrtiimonas chitiniclastica TaxID=400946 RepID=UPI001BCDC994|nr:hypothetical protein [Wohlfahrtiimonas chitiniclastica]MBS7837350.1 hypothetical protein [Wohlfahrtiimonas chitiniclastica]
MIKVDRTRWILAYARIIEFKPSESNKKYLTPQGKKYSSLFQIAGIAIKGSLSSSYTKNFDSLEEAEQHMDFLSKNRYIDYKALRSNGELFDSGNNKFNERIGNDWIVTHKMYHGCTDVDQVIDGNELYLVEEYEELKEAISKYGPENISAFVNTIDANDSFIFAHRSSYYLQHCLLTDEEIRFSNGINENSLFNRKIFSYPSISYYTTTDNLLLVIKPVFSEIHQYCNRQLELFA